MLGDGDHLLSHSVEDIIVLGSESPVEFRDLRHFPDLDKFEGKFENLRES